MHEREEIRFKLFVSGASPRSLRAIVAVTSFCEGRLAGRFTLHIVDAFLEPDAARAHQIVALPTLLKTSPAPRRLYIGDMSDLSPLAAGLGLSEQAQ